MTPELVPESGLKAEREKCGFVGDTLTMSDFSVKNSGMLKIGRRSRLVNTKTDEHLNNNRSEKVRKKDLLRLKRIYDKAGLRVLS